MNSIVSFRLPDPPEPELVQKVRRISKPLEILALLLLLGMGLLVAFSQIALFFYEGPLFRIDHEYVYVFFSIEEAQTVPNSIAISDLSLFTRSGMSIIVLLQYVPILIMLWLMKQLFGCLKVQPLFSVNHAKLLFKIGGWLVFFAVIPAFTDQIAAAVGSPDRNWFKYSSIGAVILGGLLMLLSRVMYHGSTIEKENASFL